MNGFLLGLHVDGLPQPQGSKRHIGKGRMIEANYDRLRPWRHAITTTAARQMRNQEPVNCPLKLQIDFYFPRPKHHHATRGLRGTAPIHHHTRPDLDKLVRAVNDALTGTVFRDDAQIVELNARKLYGPAHIELLLTELDNKFGFGQQQPANP